MGGPRLNSETEWRVTYIFPPDSREQARALLQEECGNNLPFCQNFDESATDRIRFAVLKLSDGDLNKLQKAIELAKTDWRDLLIAAGFANDIELHRSWLPDRKWRA
jgi:hypothetical protein